MAKVDELVKKHCALLETAHGKPHAESCELYMSICAGEAEQGITSLRLPKMNGKGYDAVGNEVDCYKEARRRSLPKSKGGEGALSKARLTYFRNLSQQCRDQEEHSTYSLQLLSGNRVSGISTLDACFMYAGSLAMEAYSQQTEAVKEPSAATWEPSSTCELPDCFQKHCVDVGFLPLQTRSWQHWEGKPFRILIDGVRKTVNFSVQYQFQKKNDEWHLSYRVYNPDGERISKGELIVAKRKKGWEEKLLFEVKMPVAENTSRIKVRIVQLKPTS